MATKPRCRITAKQHRANLKKIAEFSAQEKAAAEERRADYRAAVAQETASLILATERRAKELLERFGFGDWRPLLSLQEKPRKMPDWQWEQLASAQDAMYEIDWLNQSLARNINYDSALLIERLRTIALRMEWLPLKAIGDKNAAGRAESHRAQRAERERRKTNCQTLADAIWVQNARISKTDVSGLVARRYPEAYPHDAWSPTAEAVRKLISDSRKKHSE